MPESRKGQKRRTVWLRYASVAVFFVCCSLSCRSHESEPVGCPAPSASSAIPLGPRAEVVAIADSWAVQGARSGGRAGARLLFDAGSLRERIYRLEHREADALEAVELYAQAARTEPTMACEANTARALLDAEVHRDVPAAYLEIYRIRARSADSGCRERSDRVLATLAAYRPLQTVLGQIDTQSQEPIEPRPAAAIQKPNDTPDASSAAVPAPRETGPFQITRVERYGAADAARVVVFVTQPTTFDVGFLDAHGTHPRLFVDIHQASYRGLKTFDVGGLVEQVRLGSAGGRTRVVLDLRTTAYQRVFYLPEPFRLVIDLSKAAPVRIDPKVQGPRKVRRVVLDPGHGGHDPGATGPSGLREKDVTLDIAHRAAPLIARELGISTLLTRDGDDFVALDERTARANAFQADLFVSIHCNATEDGSGRGVMTFILDDSRDALASRIAARENSASAAAAVELANALGQGGDHGDSQASAHFAELLQRAAIASLAPAYPDIPDSGVKRAGFYVLAGARMPAALFETSFISSPTGEARFNIGDFRQKIADAIVNAVRAYRAGL